MNNGQLNTVQTDYFNGFTYNDHVLGYIATETGRILKESGGSFRYEYNLTDHLGNVRTILPIRIIMM